LFSILSDVRRRQILVVLLEASPGESVDLEEIPTVSQARTETRHVHLPKLDDSGFVDWDRDSGHVSRGPAFEEGAPVVRLLHDNRADLPEGWV